MPHDLDRRHIPGNQEVESVFSGLPRGKDPNTGRTLYYNAGVTTMYDRNGNLVDSRFHSSGGG